MCSEQQQTCARDIVTSLPCVLDSEGGGAVMFGRSLVTGLGIGLDYKWSLWGLEDTSEEHQEVMKTVHTRSASKILDTCLDNGGLYIKFGQVRCRILMISPTKVSPAGSVHPGRAAGRVQRRVDEAAGPGAQAGGRGRGGLHDPGGPRHLQGGTLHRVLGGAHRSG